MRAVALYMANLATFVVVPPNQRVHQIHGNAGNPDPDRYSVGVHGGIIRD